LAGAALQLIPWATEALLVKLSPGASAPLPPPVVAVQSVEAVLDDWCASHGEARRWRRDLPERRAAAVRCFWFELLPHVDQVAFEARA